MPRDDYINTYSGLQFHFANPHESEVALIDIAHALSQLTRFGGHLRRFYSVAEHCVHMCRAVPVALKREALLHDASEAYLMDMQRPIKAVIPQYTVLEKGVERVIANKFSLQYPWPQEIKTLDNEILLTEWIMFGNGSSAREMLINNGETPLDVRLEGWPPGLAEMQFLNEAYTWLV